jgi:hypothetical protein
MTRRGPARIGKRGKRPLAWLSASKYVTLRGGICEAAQEARCVARSTPQRRIRDLYGFAFPDEFFRFREFLGRLPEDLLGEACSMHPAYAFDAAAGRPPRGYPRDPLWEDRYYHDLPEFVTLFTGETGGLHWGYFFDAPEEHPPVVVHYWSHDTFEHHQDADSLFEAVRERVEEDEIEYLEMAEDDPDAADEYEERRRQLAVIREHLAPFWGADRPEIGDDYMETYSTPTWREPAADTWDQMGIIVPPGAYRKLSADPFATRSADLRRPQIKKLAGEAMRHLEAGRPGAALKLGRDIWPWADKFPECYALLDAAYGALGREPLCRLMNAARDFRRYCDGDRARNDPNRA